MMRTILGTKIDQSQTFDEAGKRIPVTRISAKPCLVVGLKTVALDGYNAFQLGFGQRKLTRINKPELGKLKKASLDKIPPLLIREVKIEDSADLESIKIGATVKLTDVFKKGDVVQVTGVSKGKGFQGVVKRHHFKGGPRTHGQSDRERAPGSIGQTTTPGRVYKGKRMAGRMGGETTTVKNLKVVNIDEEKNLLTLSGVVPGGRHSFLIIKKISD